MKKYILHMVSERPGGGLFDSGHRYRLRATGFGGTNPTDSLAVRMARVQQLNHHPTLLHNFFNSESVALKWRLDDGTQIVFQKPGNPYGPLDFMVVGSTPQMHREYQEKLDGIFPNEMTQQGQYKYWQVTLNQLDAQQFLPSPDRITSPTVTNFIVGLWKHGTPKPTLHMLSGENVTPLSYFDSALEDKFPKGSTPATAKTIALPHRHGFVLIHDWLIPEPWSIDHVDRQQEQLRSLQNSELGKALFNRINELTLQLVDGKAHKSRYQNSVSFTVEKDIPYGYSLTFSDIHPKRRGTTPKDTEFFVDVMRAHHLAYAQAMHDLEEALSGDKKDNANTNPLISIAEKHGKPFDVSEITLPQPCYQDYLLFSTTERRGQRKLHYRVAPQISSSAGLLETTGIQLDRAPHYEPLLSEEQAKEYRRRVILRVKRLTRRDKKYVETHYDNKPHPITGRRMHYDHPDLISVAPKV